MRVVFVITMLFVFIFCVILLFHATEQNRSNTVTQLERIAHSARSELSSPIIDGNIPEIEIILQRIQQAGIISRADIIFNNQFKVLQRIFIYEHSVPETIMWLFELPIQISLPIYSLERSNNIQPIAYLVLRADSCLIYKFIMSWISTLVAAYLLLTLMITVVLTWCINRSIVHSLRRIAKELNDLDPKNQIGHQLPLLHMHRDDEIGALIRSYNINQQRLKRRHDELLNKYALHFGLRAVE